MINQIVEDIKSSATVHEQMIHDQALINMLKELVDNCLDALRKGGKVIFAGNGGSFADSQHLTAEFISRLQFDRAPLCAVALGTNSSSMSAIGNDYGYDQVFSRELRVIGNENDVFIPISTSGNSPNILNAINVAKEKSLKITGFTGSSGGKMIDLCQCIKIPSSRTERIQEGHILIGHILCGLVESEYFNDLSE
jgi:D-sedoheptulose 7-phosphate isomerase